MANDNSVEKILEDAKQIEALKEKPEAEQIAWLYDYHGFWNFNKIKWYGKAYGIVEITIKHENGWKETIKL